MERKLKLTEAHFAATGRGLICTKDIESDDVVVTVPRRLLITPHDALQLLKGPRGGVENASNISDQALLAVFLVRERREGPTSTWLPYLQSIPENFDNPLHVLLQSGEEGETGERVWFPEVLPEEVVEELKEQRETFWTDFIEAKKVLSAAKMSMATIGEFAWAWFAVNTRCVSFSDPGEKGSQALAPLLDFLNHSDTAVVTAGYNSALGRYEIRTLRPFMRGEQVFIFYGPHDNAGLYLEYGFTIPQNAMNSLCFDEELQRVQNPGDSVGFKRTKERILEDYQLHAKVTSEGREVSWKLHTALAIRTLSQSDYERREWQRLVLGEVQTLGIESEERISRGLSQVLQEKGRTERERLGRAEDRLRRLEEQGKHREAKVLRSFCGILRERVEMVRLLVRETSS